MIALAAMLVFGAFLGLGTWQVHRLTWKLELIAEVDQRVAAAPVAAPGPAAWPCVTAASDAYRRVRATGTFLDDRETLVEAVTALGGGFWVVTPFRTDAGFVVLINRGFVPPDRRGSTSRRGEQTSRETTVTGLLRMSEPNGGFLRHNDAAADRWYSRDVPAIAHARGLETTAPYFIDADAAPGAGGSPVGGLTIIAFPNNHLVYAIIWYGLAALLAGAAAWAVRDEWRLLGETPTALSGSSSRGGPTDLGPPGSRRVSPS